MEIQLTRGQVALIDDSDAHLILGWSWTAKPATRMDGKFYACRTIRKGMRSTTIYMHREIMDPPLGFVVDHINGNTLDNRRSINLRIATPSENNANNRFRLTKHGYRGIHSEGRLYRAVVQKGGENHRSRWFADPADAARAYDDIAFGLYGEYARLNFPKEEAREEVLANGSRGGAK